LITQGGAATSVFLEILDQIRNMDARLGRSQCVGHHCRRLGQRSSGTRGILLGALAPPIGSQLSQVDVSWLTRLLTAGVFAATAASRAMHGPGCVAERDAAMRARETLCGAHGRRCPSGRFSA